MEIKKNVETTYIIELNPSDYEMLCLALDYAYDYVALGRLGTSPHTRFKALKGELDDAR